MKKTPISLVRQLTLCLITLVMVNKSYAMNCIVNLAENYDKSKTQLSINSELYQVYDLKSARFSAIGNIEYKGKKLFFKSSKSEVNNHLIQKEYEGTKFLEEQGFPTPRIRFFDKENGILVRDYFEGETFGNLSESSEIADATIKLYRIFKKMRETGLIFEDLHHHNVIYNNQTGELSIIDIYRGLPGSREDQMRLFDQNRNPILRNISKFEGTIPNDALKEILTYSLELFRPFRSLDTQNLSEDTKQLALNYFSNFSNKKTLSERIRKDLSLLRSISTLTDQKIIEVISIISDSTRGFIYSPQLLKEWLKSTPPKEEVKLVLDEVLDQADIYKQKQLLSMMLEESKIDLFKPSAAPVDIDHWSIIIDFIKRAQFSQVEIRSVFTDIRGFSSEHFEVVNRLPLEMKEQVIRLMTGI